MESYTESFFFFSFYGVCNGLFQKLGFSVNLITFSSTEDWASCREPIGADEVSKPTGIVI